MGLTWEWRLQVQVPLPSNLERELELKIESGSSAFQASVLLGKPRSQRPLSNKHFLFKQILHGRDSALSMLRRGEACTRYPPCSSACPQPCGSSRNRLWVSIDPLLSSKWITSKALLNRIFILQLALLWSSGPSLTLALQRCSVWSQRWSQETWRGNWGDAGSPLPLDAYPNHSPTLHSQVRGWKIEEGLSPRQQGQQNLPEAVFLFLRGKVGKWKFRSSSSIWNIELLCLLHLLPWFTSVSYFHPT